MLFFWTCSFFQLFTTQKRKELGLSQFYQNKEHNRISTVMSLIKNVKNVT